MTIETNLHVSIISLVSRLRAHVLTVVRVSIILSHTDGLELRCPERLRHARQNLVLNWVDGFFMHVTVSLGSGKF